jgi:uncharacterized membrane protein
MSSGAPKIVGILVGLSAISLGLLVLRMLIRGDGTYGFLAWNLLLAWIPLLLAAAAVAVWRSGRRIAAAVLLALWLVFFPNAPYVITDFVHLDRIGGMPRWFDGTLLGAFAVNALALGFMSLYLIHSLIRSRIGAVWGWASALGAIALSGVGIYLGRVHQLNSWDVWQPGRLLAALTAHGRAAQSGAMLTLLLTGLLAAGYTIARQYAERHARTTR